MTKYLILFAKLTIALSSFKNHHNLNDVTILNNTSKDDSFPQAAPKMEGRRC